MLNEAIKILRLYNLLKSTKEHAFPISGKVNISSKQGVYIIFNANNQILHVGRTVSRKGGLNQRLSDHISNQSSFSKKYLTPHNIKLREIGKFKLLEVGDERERALLEALTIRKLCPLHLGTGIKA